MRILWVALMLLLAGCTTDGDAMAPDEHGDDHDHGDHDHGHGDMDAPSISFKKDESKDMLSVVSAKNVDWGKTTATLSDGCTARLEAEGMGADVGEGPMMSHTHPAKAGDTIAVDGSGECTIRLVHEDTLLGDFTFTIG